MGRKPERKKLKKIKLEDHPMTLQTWRAESFNF